MIGSMWSSDGFGEGKKSSGASSRCVMFYAMSSYRVQSLPDLADRMALAIAALESGDVIRTRTARGDKALMWVVEMSFGWVGIGSLHLSNVDSSYSRGVKMMMDKYTKANNATLQEGWCEETKELPTLSSVGRRRSLKR